MIIQTQLDNIVAKLNTISAITTLLPGGIFVWQPMKPKNSTYLVIILVSEVGNYINKNARIEFRIIGWSEDTNSMTLFDIMNTITNQIAIDTCNKIFNFNTFYVWKVNEGTMIWPNIDLNNRPVVIKDFIFTFIAR